MLEIALTFSSNTRDIVGPPLTSRSLTGVPLLLSCIRVITILEDVRLLVFGVKNLELSGVPHLPIALTAAPTITVSTAGPVENPAVSSSHDDNPRSGDVTPKRYDRDRNPTTCRMLSFSELMSITL